MFAITQYSNTDDNADVDTHAATADAEAQAAEVKIFHVLMHLQ